MEKKEALSTLRDAMATMMYDMIEHHSTPIRRSELAGDIRLAYMNERRLEYLKTRWTRNVWDEELTEYIDKTHPRSLEVRKSHDAIRITSQNSGLIAPILVRREEDIRYDFKRYMHEHWRDE